MGMRKKQEDEKTGEPGRQSVSFFVEPGTKVQITIDVGEETVEGKVPLTLKIDQVQPGEPQAANTLQPEPVQVETKLSKPVPVHGPVALARRLVTGLNTIKDRFKRYDLAKWLFMLSITVYLGTRLVGLTQFPIYFFTDEAIQAQSMIDLIDNGYRDPSGALLPTYFRNGEYYNLSLSVYLQWLPAILFGKSALLTRITSVLVTLIAAVAISIVLRDIFKLKYWWTGTLFLSITPAWFLHSRTAFETAEFVSFYAGTLCAYLFYRYKSPRYLYLTIFLGALAFYSYSPAQMLMPLTALGLLVSDWRYHWENRRKMLIGLALAAILALPYVRASINNPSAPFAHLHTLWSYWFEKIPLSEKFVRYFSEFGVGLSPWYWYVPNNRDLSRHLMKDYGNIMMVTLPFALLGMAQALRRLHLPSYRTIIITLLVSPAAAALVQMSITRALVFVIPAAILTAIGLELFLRWVEDPHQILGDLSAGPGLTARRVAAAMLILAAGIAIAFISKETINSIAIAMLALILALQISGFLEQQARSFTFRYESERLKLWGFPPSIIALAAFILLSGVNIFMLRDALRNGPLWFRDYGMGGMQYGAFQIFDIIEDYISERPGTHIIFSPDWANGTDVVARFFLRDPESIQIGSIRGHITQKLPLDDNTLFIMTPHEYDLLNESEKLEVVKVERIVPYPDGNPGFYFVRLRYTKEADALFAAEKTAREKLQESTVTIDGQQVKLRFSYLDSDHQAKSMALVFDGDPYTVAKTFEANPFVIEMTFPAPRTLNGFSIIIGTTAVQITLKCYAEPNADPIEYRFEGLGTKVQPQLSFNLPEPTQAQVLQVGVFDPTTSNPAKVHIWELELR